MRKTKFVHSGWKMLRVGSVGVDRARGSHCVRETSATPPKASSTLLPGVSISLSGRSSWTVSCWVEGGAAGAGERGSRGLSGGRTHGGRPQRPVWTRGPLRSRPLTLSRSSRSFFLEKNMFVFFLNILRQRSGRYVCVQLLQTLNILFENISHETSLCKDGPATCPRPLRAGRLSVLLARLGVLGPL